tara:strand:- start:2066 stop:2215 length:150 start_codon:yes stop_codon:yes gene_type:complete
MEREMPFGEEWKKEMKNFKKDELIEMLRSALIAKNDLEMQRKNEKHEKI